MIAYKGFTKDLTGWGGFRFEPGVTYREDTCKTVNSGFHCTEYPLACLQYFTLGGSNRYFEVEAGGEIDEDDWRIACTELTLIRELTIKELAGEGIAYMVRHPKREDWMLDVPGANILKDKAGMFTPGGIAIARGLRPRVRGCKGAVCGLVVEDQYQVIRLAKVFTVGEETKPGVWYELDEDRKLREAAE